MVSALIKRRAVSSGGMIPGADVAIIYQYCVLFARDANVCIVQSWERAIRIFFTDISTQSVCGPFYLDSLSSLAVSRLSQRSAVECAFLAAASETLGFV
jgi:hypothetical protein